MDRDSNLNYPKITESEMLSKMLELEEKIGLCVKEFTETNKELQEHLSKCVKEMLEIADYMDKFHRDATIAKVFGSSVGIAGGITTIVGLILSPFTLGTSLIVSTVGIGLSTAGGLTGASASIADSVNMRMKLKRVEEMVTEMQDLLKQIQEISKSMNKIFWSLSWKYVCNVAKVLNAVKQICRMVQLGKIIASAARGAEAAVQGVRVVTALTGVLAALFIIVDTFFIVEGAQNLRRGCETKEAANIRDLAEEFVNLQSELQRNAEEIKKEFEANSGLVPKMTFT